MAHMILVADDDLAIRTVVSQALMRAGYEVRSTGSANILSRWVEAGDGDLVITDVVMPDENIFEVLPRMKKARPHLPIVVMSAQNTFMTAIRASERGAYEYLPKPFDLDQLVRIVGQALAGSEARKAPDEDEAKSAETGGAAKPAEEIPLVGRSAAMQDVYRVLARLMNTDLTVMITGESGTGKELVARALHDFGRRRRGPFVAINMAAIPRDLIESELFGHEKGAFTGANQRSQGRFEQAEGGTLFLDEIGDMPMEAQTRLLRVLQQGEYMTVGGRTPIKTDVRIVAATNKDLVTLIEKGLFREDLYYRLSVVPIRLPPLRERLGDIPDLVRHFLSIAEKEGLPRKSVDQAGLERMKRHDWPGNIRELENLVRRLAALHPDDVIGPQAIENELSVVRRAAPRETETRIVEAVPSSGETLEAFFRNYLKTHFARFGDDLPPPGLYDRFLVEFERPLVAAALAATNGNQVRAADLLGLNRNTLRKKIRELGIRMTSAVG
ncbi:nitrogen regulation protein NR(I) [Rhabdaerophilum sp. SD176]|uniref:nitrogen regulation protein NR(I) n=1 Tax=Rhabdaerophilum sp. SD176 TaxID=2983548 RepID=UPI0024DF5103|nr:nitrogen regulation protein NR(I) [Rhabdaerophilum sp. SD176]